MLSYKTLKVQPNYTGITVDRFDVLFQHLKSLLHNVCRSKLSYQDQFLMTLVKLELNTQWLCL